jgi:hypothetical protein
MTNIIAALVLPEVSVYSHKPSRGADILGYLAAGHDVLNNHRNRSAIASKGRAVATQTSDE